MLEDELLTELLELEESEDVLLPDTLVLEELDRLDNELVLDDETLEELLELLDDGLLLDDELWLLLELDD